MLQTNLISNAHADLICDASYNFYGTRLATGGLDQRIKVWRLDEQTGEWGVEDEWKAHDAAVSRLAWAHPQHGQFLASASFDRTVRIWERIGDVGNTPGGSLGMGSGVGSNSDRWVERTLLSEAKGSVRCVEWAPTAFGMKIATISSDNHLRVYECLETATATAPGTSGGSSGALNTAANPSASTPPDSVLGINMAGAGAPASTPGQGLSTSQAWTLVWSPAEDIDIATLSLYTPLSIPGGSASPVPGQNAPLVSNLGGESSATLGLDSTSGTSSTLPGGNTGSPFMGGTQTLSSNPAGSNATSSNPFGTSPGQSGITLAAAASGANGSPGNTAASGFANMLGSPPTASAFSGLGAGAVGAGTGFGSATGTTNVLSTASSLGAASLPKVGRTASNREADGGWDLSWCKDPYWGEVCAATAGGSGIIKIIQFQAGQRPRCVLFLDPRPSFSNGETLGSKAVTPTSTPYLRAQQPASGSHFLSPHPTAAAAVAGHPKPSSPKPSTYATTSIAWAPSCGRSYHLIAAGSRDGRVRIWKVRPPPLKNLNGEDESESDTNGEGDEDEGQEGGGGGNASSKDKTSWSASIVGDFEDHASAVGKVAWNITGTVLTSAGNDGRVRLWKCTYGNVWRPMGSLDVIQDEDTTDGERMEE